MNQEQLSQPTAERRQFLKLGAAAASLACISQAVAQPAAQAPAADRWQLGCFTRPFGEFSFAETLVGIAQAGFKAVGLMSMRLPEGGVTLTDATQQQAATAKQMAADHDLVIATTYYSGPPVQKSLQEGIAGMRKLIDNCSTAGCKAILLGGTTKEALYEDYYRAVSANCDYAAELKISLTLKPHGGLNATGPQCRQTIQRVDHPIFTMWYDPGNIYYYSDGELNPVEDAATVAGLVTGVCIKDFQPPKEVAINPGSGKVDFPAVLQTLHAGGFTEGPLIVETLAPGDYQDTVNNARMARVAMEQWLTKL
jgi:sugar phosphate isomerase/epimerase